MSLSELTSKEAVISAIQEFDKLGRDAFLKKYGFNKSREYFLTHEGKTYDSKAIVGAAYKHQNGKKLTAYDFSGGNATVLPVLERLGFSVLRKPSGVTITSNHLVYGSSYSRDDLKDLFGIVDSTINTGVFRPKGHNSVWLFVTENKSSDRTQYVDKLEGDVLQWQGQLQGRTDHYIVEQSKNGLDILLFYRTSKTDKPKGAFTYEGPFSYVSHSGSNPSSFLLKRINSVESSANDAESEGQFSVTDLEDSRRKMLRSIALRRGQNKFRRLLIEAYEGKCAVTGCDVIETLEAAHIHPYRGDETHHVQNGLLLRADIHTLFDLGLITIDSDSLNIVMSKSMSNEHYAALDGQVLRIPSKNMCTPSVEALKWHNVNSFRDGHIYKSN